MKNVDAISTSRKLSPLPCPLCRSELHAHDGDAKKTTSIDDCLRRCQACNVGFSNGRSKPTLVYGNPLQNIPEQVWGGAEETVAASLNKQHRRDKWVKFGFSTSEDAVTWTVFTFLRTSRQLGSVLRSLGVASGSVEEPEVLLWGTPQPLNSRHAALIRERVIAISNNLGEAANSRSEPDVIADFGRFGLVILEVKYGAANDGQEFSRRHEKYFAKTDAFSHTGRVRESRLYELVRNWRIGVQLADGAPFTLLNLVVNRRNVKEIAAFNSGLNDRKGQFRVVTWEEMRHQFNAPEWLHRYLDTKGLGSDIRSLN